MQIIYCLLVSLISLLLFFLLWFVWRKYHMKKLRRFGIPGPEPHILYGNLIEYMNKGHVKCHEEWIEKYGRIVGYYLGGKPYVLIADAELLELIQIDDCDQFVNRPLFIDHGISLNKTVNKSLIKVDLKRWKIQRDIMKQIFSDNNLKQITPIVSQAITALIAEISEYSVKGKEFDIHRLFQYFSIDIMARIMFGVSRGISYESDNRFVSVSHGKHSPKLGEFLLTLSLYFPEFGFIIKPVRRVCETIRYVLHLTDYRFLLNTCVQVIEKRKANLSHNYRDLLQFLIDTQTQIYNKDETYLGNQQTEGSYSFSGKFFYKLSMDEISANCALMFDACHQTTSSALAYTFHVLINHSNVQEAIREEIHKLHETDGTLDFNAVLKLPFMEQVIYETLRLYPPLTAFTSRSADTDYHYGNITIPGGTDCRVAVHYLHRDPLLWVEANSFIAHRFSPENRHIINPVVWQPFGCGPRNCIGKRFAGLLIKLTIAMILMKYKFVATANSEIGDIENNFKVCSITPRFGVIVKAVPFN